MANEAEIIASNLLSSAIEYKRLYDTTKKIEYREKEQRLRRIAENVKLLASSSSASTVNSFNGRTGAITLTSADVTGALGYVPPTTLNGLTDVTISAPANAQVLTYNSTTLQWENQTPAAGGGGDMSKSTYDVDNDGVVDSAETTQIIVRNSTGSTLLKGQVVYLSGATGNRPNAVLSRADTEVTATKTIGIVVANINNNSDGYVAVSGTLHNLDTSAFADGVAVWLSATTAGGMTSTIPAEPNHTVFIGYIARAHPTQGRLVIVIQNGYELNELHGVLISSEANNDLLVYESSSTLWKNKSISTIFGGTPLVSVPTLAQVTTAGNTTTNAITVGELTVVGTSKIYLKRNPTTLALPIIYGIDSAGDEQNRIIMYDDMFGGIEIGAKRSTSVIRFTVGAGSYTERMRIVGSTGNVLINTTTDAGYKLDVNGTGIFRGNLEVNASSNGQIFINNVYPRLLFGKAGTPSWSMFADTENAGQFEMGKGAGFPYNTFSRYLYFGTVGQGGVGLFGIPSGNTKFLVSGSTNAQSNLAQGVYFNNTLVAAANNDVLVGLDINPTFTNGAFTGVQNRVLRITNNNTTYAPAVFINNATGSYINTLDQLAPNLTTTQSVAFTLGVNAATNNTVGFNFYYAGSGSTSNAATFTFWGGSPLLWLRANGNLQLGTSTDAGFKLDVNGTARVQGKLTVSTGGVEITGNSLFTGLLSANSATSFFNSSVFNGRDNFYGGGNTTLTFGYVYVFQAERQFQPSSGNATYISFYANPLINQTGTANGITRGLYINPTITAAADYRAIETTTGKIIFQGLSNTTTANVVYYDSSTGLLTYGAVPAVGGGGTVTSVSGTGTVSGLTLSGTVTSSGSLTLGGTLSLTSGDVTTALGFTPYNATNPAGYTTNTGTVTSVGLSSTTSGVTIGATPITTSGTITIDIATAATAQNGLLSSTDWNTFNGKQSTITLTTTGTSGAATLIGNVLNIPNYATGSSQWTTSGSNIYYTTGNVLIGTSTASGQKLQVLGNFFVKGTDSLSSTKVFEVQNGAGASIMDFRNATYAFFGCGQGGGSNSGFIFNYSNTSYTQFSGYNYGGGSGAYKPILMDTDIAGRGQGIFVNFGTSTLLPPNSDTEFAVRGRTADATSFITRFRESGNTDRFAVRCDGALFTNTLQGYSGALNIPSNPVGSRVITITNGLITNIA